MTNRRIAVGVGVGAGLALAILLVAVLAVVVLAVQGGREVSIPLLVTATSGAGSDLLELQVNPVGTLVWLVGLSAVLALPFAAARRRVR